MIVDVVLAPHLAVGRDVDAERDLLAHDLVHGVVEGGFVGVARDGRRGVGVRAGLSGVIIEPGSDGDARGFRIGPDGGGQHGLSPLTGTAP